MAHEIGFSLEGGESWAETLAMATMMDEGGVLTALVPQHELWLQANHPSRSDGP